MPNCASIQSHRVSIVVYLNLSTMWHPDTKVLSILPEYSGKWLLIVKGLSNLGFQVCRAENHPIQYLQTPLKRVKPNTGILVC